MAERGAGARRHRQHRGDAGDDGEVERAPGLRARLDLGAHRRRHGEHAGIAAGDDGDLGTLRRMAQRRRGAGALLAVVGGMARLAVAHGNAVEIGAVAIDGIGGGEQRAGLRGEPARVARAEADHREMPAHDRPSQPGTSTTAK